MWADVFFRINRWDTKVNRLNLFVWFIISDKCLVCVININQASVHSPVLRTCHKYQVIDLAN